MSGLAGIGLLARLSGLRRVLGAVPPKAWLALAIALMALTGVLWHHHRVHRHDAALRIEQKAADDKLWTAAFAKEHAAALAWKKGFDQQAATISRNERTKHEEALRTNAAAADTLRLRGPGAASAAHCGQGDHPGLSTGSGGHEQAAAATGAASAQVPADDRAIVPWSFVVNLAREHDDLLDEATRWRENDARQREAWGKR